MRFIFSIHANYHRLIPQYKKISLTKERRLIASAQKGSVESRNEIIFRHIGFIIFRAGIKIGLEKQEFICCNIAMAINMSP